MPLKWAKCHPDRPNHGNGKCKPCYEAIHSLDVQCLHANRNKDKCGRCKTCVGRFYYLRRKQGIGDAFGTLRQSANLRSVKDPVLRRRLVKRKWRLKLYNLTLQDYDRLLADQLGVCAICKQPPSVQKDLTVDHNHGCCPVGRSCGKCVRGLLCHGCNMRLGQLESDLVKRSLDYLEHYEHSHVSPLKC
jgi:hypothetical protein